MSMLIQTVTNVTFLCGILLVGGNCAIMKYIHNWPSESVGSTSLDSNILGLKICRQVKKKKTYTEGSKKQISKNLPTGN